ncbi:hypothetical protein KIN20_017261 [Parelaphostrongylus tenuis]|uniref:Uncharacterized protein n=1 Tax=Parelaphostrongylus tenuis TaxID=148309 RepID=A0AAD5N2E0_PARTN|nr:hypothetical protein KIN20_017261 [Parelaphostrongylus tenuis]
MKFSASTVGDGSHSSWQTSSNHPAVAGTSKIAGGTIMMLPNATPFTSCLAQQNVADENRATIRELERISSSLSERSRSQLSEHNNSIGNAQQKLRSLSTASQNPQKSIVCLRDEYGQLRRARRLPDGTLLLKKRPPRDLASLSGWIPKETRPDAEVQGHQSSKAGTVWDAQSIAGIDGKGTEKLAFQRKRCEELLRSRKESVPTWRHDELHRSQTLGNSDDTTQLGTRKRRKDELNPDSGDEIVLDAIKEPIASLTLSESTGAKGQQMIQKRGRPVKKYRGRMAREKQAIRDAERAEKVAIKEKKLPVLELALKVIEDPTVEVSVEAPVLIGSSVIRDTAVLHEVGDVLKELVAQIAVKELQPKSSRSRRCWEHLPVRVPSKRQEYRKLNVPVEQRSPPPSPLKSKPRGRNSEKYQRSILERENKQCEERAASNLPSGEGPSSL